MTDTSIVFMTGTLLSFPVLYWIIDKLVRKEGRAPVRGPRHAVPPSEGSAFQRLLMRESLDRVLSLVDDLQGELTAATSRPGLPAHDKRLAALSEEHRRSIAECTDLVSALLADDDARQIRAALSRLEKTTTREEFRKSLGYARNAATGLRQNLVGVGDEPAR